MSLNISGSRFVKVYNPKESTVIPNTTTALLKSSRKTNTVNKSTGKVVAKKVYSEWNGLFVGSAYEPSLGLRNNQSIDIVNGWIEKRNGKVTVVISDYSICDNDLIEPQEDESVLDSGFNKGDMI